MALFKIFKGDKENLPAKKTAGYMYLTQDDGLLYVDLTDEVRISVNAELSKGIMKEDGTPINPDEFLTINDIVDVEHGGTGLSELQTGSLLVGDTDSTMQAVPSAVGVLQASADGAIPAFDIVPISLGGTGGTSAQNARDSLSLYSQDEIDTNVTTATFEPTLVGANWVDKDGVPTYTLALPNLMCGKNGKVPPIVTWTTNQEEYNLLLTADGTPKTGITFTATELPTSDIEIIVMDVK